MTPTESLDRIPYRGDIVQSDLSRVEVLWNPKDMVDNVVKSVDTVKDTSLIDTGNSLEGLVKSEKIGKEVFGPVENVDYESESKLNSMGCDDMAVTERSEFVKQRHLLLNKKLNTEVTSRTLKLDKNDCDLPRNEFCGESMQKESNLESPKPIKFIDMKSLNKKMQLAEIGLKGQNTNKKNKSDKKKRVNNDKKNREKVKVNEGEPVQNELSLMFRKIRELNEKRKLKIDEGGGGLPPFQNKQELDRISQNHPL